MTEATSARRSAIAAAALVFSVTAPLTYAVIHVYERLNPTLIVVEGHAGFYWRAIVATWWGGLLAIVAWRVFERRPERLPHRADRLLYAVLWLAPVMGWLSYRYP